MGWHAPPQTRDRVASAQHCRPTQYSAARRTNLGRHWRFGCGCAAHDPARLTIETVSQTCLAEPEVSTQRMPRLHLLQAEAVNGSTLIGFVQGTSFWHCRGATPDFSAPSVSGSKQASDPDRRPCMRRHSRGGENWRRHCPDRGSPCTGCPNGHRPCENGQSPRSHLGCPRS